MTLWIGSLQLGLLYGIMAIGIYISFRILNTPDLTAEGSFTFGLAVSAIVTVSGHPFLGIILAVLAGALAGAVTAFLQTKLFIHPVLAGILTMSGLYSINLWVMGGSSNLSLIGKDTIFKSLQNVFGMDANLAKTVLAVFAAGICVVLLIIFFKTQLGLCIRAVGDNAAMVSASSINVDRTKLIGFCVSNALIGLSGAIIAQYQGYADINSGMGILVVGLASVIIGEVFLGRRGVSMGIVAAILGSVVYRFIIAWATKSSFFPAYMLKLVSAVIVAIALAIPAFKYYKEIRKIKKGGEADA
ncbi:MAG: ABC transporter permease [Clostridiales bacterium]|nr:MAG: ABC transporter permease [Clostridiales bacterium]